MGTMARRPLLLLALLALAGPVLASETGLTGGEGHPRARLPLAVWAPPLGDAPLDAALRRAVGDWNALARATLGLEAFAWAGRREDAQVTLALGAAPSPKLMGETDVRSDAAGVIDEVGLNIHPVLLGSGVPLFRDAGRRIKLALQESRVLDGGCVLATYRVRGRRG